MHSRSFWLSPFWPLAIIAFAGVATTLASTTFDDGKPFELRLRSRVETDGQYRMIETPSKWNPKETALIVCDMWDLHHCANAVKRETEMAPAMERLLKTARAQGAVIIHAPSSCMDPYKDHPARKHALTTARSKTLPKEIGSWCYNIPSEAKGKYPIDQTDGGEDDDPIEHKAWAAKLSAMGRNPKAPWKSQIDVLTIANDDYISDNGEEIWSILEDRGIKNVALMGVHLNMCVLGRPFGLRQLAKNGKNVVLMRDMTDTMYNPKMSPFVNHFAGTDLIVEHIEKFVCPTITSDQILGGKPFRFKDDSRPTVAFVIGDDEYRTEASLPAFASKHLIANYRAEFILDQEGARDNLAGISLLDDADLVFISARRRVLPKDQVDALRRFVDSGKPVIGIRTASHAFAPKAGAKVSEGRDAWIGFDAEVLGGHYTNHHGTGSKVAVTLAPGVSHPILEGVEPSKLVGHGTLYKVSPLAKTATPLLIGTIPGKDAEPVAWVNAPTFGHKVFYTSLGQIDDFQEEAFNRLLKNAVGWALGK
jgi:nicotinamidase-related amidase/type 1 glutamine amidotransferase